MVAVLLALVQGGAARETEDSPDGGSKVSLTDAARREVETKGRFFTVPFEMDTDGNADDGGATVLRILPVFAVKLNADWNLLNMSIITVADAPGGRPGSPGNPEPVPGPAVFGLGDFAHAVLFGPSGEGPVHWGTGFMARIPTATDPRLGSGKWSAGPAFRFVYSGENWSLAALLANTWSFAGDEDRGDINQLMLRFFYEWEFSEDWLLVSAPILTANWNAENPDRWRIPVGGGIARDLKWGSAPFRLSAQVYNNVIKPDGAPDWQFRMSVVVPIPR